MKKWIKEILGINQLEKKIKSLEKVIEQERLSTRQQLDELYDKLIIRFKYNEEFTSSINYRLDGLQEHFNVGLDVSNNEYDRSWAVVCINDKRPLVQFIDLSGYDRDYIRHKFIEPFRSDRRTIDSPANSFYMNKIESDRFEIKKGRNYW